MPLQLVCDGREGRDVCAKGYRRAVTRVCWWKVQNGDLKSIPRGFMPITAGKGALS